MPKIKSFTEIDEETATAQLKAWRREHPEATIVNTTTANASAVMDLTLPRLNAEFGPYTIIVEYDEPDE